MIKKILKWLAIIVAVLIAVVIIFGIIANEKMPEGTPSPEADAKANKMLEAINYAAWDSTTYVQWSFPGGHDYLWDKDRNLVRIVWGDHKVLLNTKTVNGKAFKGGVALEANAANKLIQKAWNYFCNDSFWLNAPAKVFDPGTSRSLVTLKDGREGLMIRYESGGVTPGDTYVWIMDENGLPVAWKMWIKIVPIGGIEAGWSDWITLSTGSKIAQAHSTAGPTLKLTNVKGEMDWKAMGEESDPFAGM